MGYSWSLYAPIGVKVAERAVDAMYEALESIVGAERAEEAEPGEMLDPPELGLWPSVFVPKKPTIPTVEEERASLADPKKENVRFEEAALDRLAKCTAHIRIDDPKGFDPATVSALRVLIGKLGPCVFIERQGFDLTTSESLLVALGKRSDLEDAIEAVEDGDDDDEEKDEDEDDDEDDDDLDDDDEEEEDEEEEEHASPSARAEVLRSMLAEIAQQPRLRRKVGELLEGAPKPVVAYTERLARVGAEPDSAVAAALRITEKEAASARAGLAALLRRAEGRR